MDAPKTIYCLRCRSHQDCADVKLVDTKFKSKKSQADMTRQAWRGTCGKCQKSVSRFAKVAKKEAEKELAPPPEKMVKVAEAQVVVPMPEEVKAVPAPQAL